MKSSLNRTECVKAATYVFCQTCENSTSGNYYIPINEVERYLGKEINKEAFYKICTIIRQDFELQVLDVNENDDEYAWGEAEFNMNIGTNYILYEEKMNSESDEDEEWDDEDEDKKPEPSKMSPTIEYISKENGMLYVRFNADEGDAEKQVLLFCHDDDTGSHDITVSQEQLQQHFIETKRYMEEQ